MCGTCISVVGTRRLFSRKGESLALSNARSFLQNALTIIQELQDSSKLVVIYSALAGVEAGKGNQEQAVIYLKNVIRFGKLFNRASRTKAVNFIVKPFNELQLQRAIEMVVKKMVDTPTTKPKKEWEEDVLFKEQFFIKHRHRLEKVQLTNILYFEADGHYCALHLRKKEYLLRMSLNKLAERSPDQRFLQTHRSFVVNKEKIESVDLQDNLLYLGDRHVPLRKRNRESVLQSLDFIG